MGLHSADGGGFSEYVAVNESMCYVLPDSIPLAEAALIEPLTVARHAARSSGFHDYSDKTILILGGGPVGIALMFMLKSKGVGKLIVSEPTAKRQQQTAKFVDVVVDPSKAKVGDECRKLTDGNGVDIVFDCAGIMPGLRDGMDALRRGGTYVNVAGWEKDVSVFGRSVIGQKLTGRTVHHSNGTLHAERARLSRVDELHGERLQGNV